MLSRLPAVALILLLALAAPAPASPDPASAPIAPSPVQMVDILSVMQRVLDEHPAPPDAVFLMRAGMRGGVRELEALGIEDAQSLFTYELSGSLTADAAMIDKRLEPMLARLTPEQRGKVLLAALGAALESLDDPGSHLYAPGKYQATLEELGYSLGGVGFFVDEQKDEKGRLVIIEMFEGFPAERQGIRPGDRLVAAGGHPTSDLTFNELTGLIRGPVGTRVSLTIQRGEEPPKDYTLTREWLNPNPKGIESRLVRPGVGYVKVKYLGHRVHHDLRLAVDALAAQGARGLLLDLRNCPGVPAGAVGVADLFLPAGKLVMTEVSRNEQAQRLTVDPASFTMPVVVLINRYSSGAAALAAGALRDHGRAVLVGEATDPEEMRAYEKVAEELRDGSTGTVTVAYYRLPRGKSLWKETLRPDVEVPEADPTAHATGQPGDLQFERAVQLLKVR